MIFVTKLPRRRLLETFILFVANGCAKSTVEKLEVIYFAQAVHVHKH